MGLSHRLSGVLVEAELLEAELPPLALARGRVAGHRRRSNSFPAMVRMRVLSAKCWQCMPLAVKDAKHMRKMHDSDPAQAGAGSLPVEGTA